MAARDGHRHDLHTQPGSCYTQTLNHLDTKRYTSSSFTFQIPTQSIAPCLATKINVPMIVEFWASQKTMRTKIPHCDANQFKLSQLWMALTKFIPYWPPFLTCKAMTFTDIFKRPLTNFELEQDLDMHPDDNLISHRS